MRRNFMEHVFIEIPEGFSCIGSDELDPYASEKEKPLRYVYLSTFWISKFPTTVSQFAFFLNEMDISTVRYPHMELLFGKIVPVKRYEDFPATGVSWEMASAYCHWLSNRIHRNVVLPSEAEWEKAARGEEGYIWPWGNEFDKNRCNSMESGNNSLCSVFEYADGASPYGVMHLSGNVWEWCIDYWHPYSHGELAMINPFNMHPSGRKVVKGGSAYCTKEIVRPACRDWTNSVNQGGWDDGFRVILRSF